jgi:hypothetical protein
VHRSAEEGRYTNTKYNKKEGDKMEEKATELKAIGLGKMDIEKTKHIEGIISEAMGESDVIGLVACCCCCCCCDDDKIIMEIETMRKVGISDVEVMVMPQEIIHKVEGKTRKELEKVKVDVNLPYGL